MGPPGITVAIISRLPRLNYKDGTYEDPNYMTDAPILIAGICGSLRGPESYTRKLLCHVMDEVARTGAATDFLDLAELPLPMCKAPDDRPENKYAQELHRRIGLAHGIVLATPEYHNSYSGVLKNTLDLLSYEELSGKAFGLVGISGGDTGAVNALSHLRIVVRGVGGHCIPAQVSLPSVYRHFEGETLTDCTAIGRIRDFAISLVRFTRLVAFAGGS